MLTCPKISIFKFLFSIDCDDGRRKNNYQYLLPKSMEDFGRVTECVLRYGDKIWISFLAMQGILKHFDHLRASRKSLSRSVGSVGHSSRLVVPRRYGLKAE
jgi:hypothetical protein